MGAQSSFCSGSLLFVCKSFPKIQSIPFVYVARVCSVGYLDSFHSLMPRPAKTVRKCVTHQVSSFCPRPPPSQTKLQRYNTPPPIDGCYRWSRGGFINLRRQNAPAGASCVPSLENKSHPIFFDAAHSCLFKDGNRRVGPVVVNSAQRHITVMPLC